MTDLVAAGFLTAWGTALLLAWTGAKRCVEWLHLHLAARGMVPIPVRLLLPMRVPAPGVLALLALLIGAAGSLAFLDQSVQAFPPLKALIPGKLSLAAQAFRLLLAEAVMLIVLLTVAEHPRWKLGWVAGWALFSLAVALC